MAGCARGLAFERSTDATEPDAPAPDATRADASIALDATSDAPGCAISAGASPVFDTMDDLAKYPASARLTPGAMMGADAVAITWDRARLYVTATSDAFLGATEPLHLYLEARTSFDPAAPSSGKEYSGLVPALPFTPNYLVAARRVTDAGTGAYDGVFVPDVMWQTRQTPLEPGTDVFGSPDQRTLSVQVAWASLGGCPTAMRLALHVVHAVTGNEWKDLIPTTHAPWLAPGGGYYEIDLTADPSAASWTLR